MIVIKTTQTPAAENEKWPRIWVRFFTNFYTAPWSEKNTESCRNRPGHSGSVDISASGVGNNVCQHCRRHTFPTLHCIVISS